MELLHLESSDYFLVRCYFTNRDYPNLSLWVAMVNGHPQVAQDS